MYQLDLAFRCEALFASDLQRSQHPDPTDVRAAVARTISRLGERACLARMAQEFGDHPEAAAARMRWAREVVRSAYPGSGVPAPRGRTATAFR
ncbi:hypothetical protein RB614_18010 [Phytohabitans sp. ZYX-F-186]|uniref:Uncharacterized protein n=1 Tax=Phytohabitans maris TaxID=3071409 RepID=A0ABU0ZHF8_9ACTN|nr:hypothetical protein [Phytohabitans sp. ZYX-F-186]MDQ7906413.1 hypothetical protein [Phytohabitans sp. ZYX-F-186]